MWCLQCSGQLRHFNQYLPLNLNWNLFYVSSQICVFIQHFLFALIYFQTGPLASICWNGINLLLHFAPVAHQWRKKMSRFDIAPSCLPHQYFYSASLFNYSATTVVCPKWSQLVCISLVWRLNFPVLNKMDNQLLQLCTARTAWSVISSETSLSTESDRSGPIR